MSGERSTGNLGAISGGWRRRTSSSEEEDIGSSSRVSRASVEEKRVTKQIYFT